MPLLSEIELSMPANQLASKRCIDVCVYLQNKKKNIQQQKTRETRKRESHFYVHRRKTKSAENILRTLMLGSVFMYQETIH